VEAEPPDIFPRLGSPLSADDMFLTHNNVDRTEFLEEFKKEADFIASSATLFSSDPVRLKVESFGLFLRVKSRGHAPRPGVEETLPAIW
jgi:hypothetical protein